MEWSFIRNNFWRINVQVSTVKKNGVGIAIVHSDEILISDVHSALDFIASYSSI